MANKWDVVLGTEDYLSNEKRLKNFAEKNGLMFNPDQERVEKVLGLMVMNRQEAGKYFCPCKQSQPINPEKDVVCPCPELKQEVGETGGCHCKLFFKQ